MRARKRREGEEKGEIEGGREEGGKEEKRDILRIIGH